MAQSDLVSRVVLVPLMLLALSLSVKAGPEDDKAAPADDPEGFLSDGAYLTACGPIACFAALRAIGIDPSLKDVAEACGWKKGKMTTLAEMHRALSKMPEVSSIPTRLTPNRLGKVVAEDHYVAILPIRKRSEDIDHAVCVVRATDDTFLIVDYPELGRWRTKAELGNIWDGEVLLVRRKDASRQWRNYSWFVAPVAISLGALCLVLGRRSNSRATPTPSSNEQAD